MGMRNWRRKSQDREQWRTILEEATVHRRLKCHKKNKERGEKKEKNEEKKKEKEN
jgi:hypothetical protein